MRSPAKEESGFSLVELMVASAVMIISLVITSSILAAIGKDTTSSFKVGAGNEFSQEYVYKVSQYLQDIDSPELACSSLPVATCPGSSGTADPYPCWGNQLTTGTSTTIVPTSASSIAPVAQTEIDELGIIFASDYQLEFCAYPPDSTSSPHIYDIYIDPTTCVSSTETCTVDIRDLTPTGASYETYLSTFYPNADGSAPPTAGNVIATIPDVWCDSFCQPTSSTVTGESGLEVMGVSCYTQLNLSSYTPAAGCTTSALDATQSPSPPLFQYVGSSTNTSCSSTTTLPLQVGCAVNVPQNFPDLYESNGSSNYSPLSTMQSIVINMKILATPVPPDVNSGTPGVEGTQQVQLANLIPTNSTTT